MDTVIASTLLEEALDHMSKYKMEDAEGCYSRILDSYQEASTSADDATPVPKQVHWSDQSKRLSTEEIDILSKTLSGLADVALKKAQMKRRYRADWFYYYLCAMTYLREAMHLCEKNEDLADGWKDMDVVSQKVGLEQRLETFQQTYLNNIKLHVLYGKENTLNFEWLDEFQKFIVECLHNEQNRNKEEEVPKKPEACTVSRERSLKKEKKIEPKKPKMMDINKLQKAISKLVRNIAADVRGRHRKRLSEETMRRTVSCEIFSLLSPISDDEELAKLFERVIAEDEEPEEISTSVELDIDTSCMRSGLKSKRESSDSLSSCTSSPKHLPKTKCSSSSSSTSLAEGQSIAMDTDQQITAAAAAAGGDCQGPNTYQSGNADDKDSAVSMQDRNSPSQEDNNQPTPTTVTVEDPNGNTSTALITFDETVAKAAGPPYNLPGVLTLWKSYNSSRPSTLQVKPYKLQGFEEVSPLTETTSATFTESDRKPSPRQHITVYPLAPNKLFEVLAHILTDLVTFCKSDISCDVAAELYKYALGLVYQCETSNRNGVLIARILQKIGVLKSGRGDIVAGCQLLNEAMQVYKALPMKNKPIHIVKTWVDLGQAYLKEPGHVTSLFSHIMNEVRSELSQEFKPETFHIPVIEESDDSDSSQGDSYSLHIYEAIDCLESALGELQNLSPTEENNKSLLVTILTKLADCHIVTGNYDKAICLYEEAMGHCKQAYGPETVENNAHMLSMLGICNFLLGHYPKAASLLETASILQQHILGTESNFGMIFTLTMLALNYYKMRQYHRCIIWCMKSNEKSQILYDCPIEEVMASLDFNRAWYVIQNLFTLGYAYYTLDFNEKAIHYLETAKDLLDRCTEVDIKQHVKLLKVTADTYVKVEWHESALQVYKNALTLAATIGNEKSSVALTNQLLNCMANVEVNVQHYAGAADYLEQALDHQKNVESNIKEDLIGLQYQLGKTYTLSGDIDKAIDCFEECLESIREIPGTPGKEMGGALMKMANLYFVKGLMQDDNDYMNEILLLAQNNFAKAVSCDSRSTASIYYANYLMQQGDFAEAVYLLLRPVFQKQTGVDKEIVFAGVEQALIPEHLSEECQGMDEVVLETKVFSCFIVLLCCKQLGLVKDVDDCLVIMYKSVQSSKNAFSHMLMAYAFLETGLFEEAAESFAFSSNSASCENIQLALANSCMCYCVYAYQTLFRGFLHIFEFLQCQRRVSQTMTIAETKVAFVSVTPENNNIFRRNQDPQEYESETETQQESFEDQGIVNMTISSFESSTSRSRSDILNTSSHYESDSSFVTDQSMLSDDSMGSESLSRDSYKRMDNSSFLSEDEVWETLDEKGNVIETRVTRSNAVPSTIYEVENNGNYTSEYDQTIHDLQVIAGETSNANYQNMVEIVSTPQNENWSTTQICDNEHIIRNETSTSIVVSTSHLSSPKRKRPESLYTYPSKHVTKSVYSSSYLPVSSSGVEHVESDSEEEVWQTFEETVDTPDVLIDILKRQGKL